MSVHNFHRLQITVAFAVSLLTLEGHAQRNARDITGIVKDKHHEPLRGAIVEVHNEATNSVISFITGVDGRYSFKRLSGDCDYKVWATWHDRRSPAKKLSVFDTKRTKVVDLTVRMH